MQLIINGNPKQFNGINTIAQVVSQINTSKHIIAEINGQIIRSTDWDKTPVNDGDTIELVTFVGGG